MNGEFDIVCYIKEMENISTLNVVTSVKDTLNKIVINSDKIVIRESNFIPTINERWQLFHCFYLSHTKLRTIFDDYENELVLQFIPYNSEYGNDFIFRISVLEDNFEVINETVWFMVDLLKEWIKYRNIRSIHLLGSNAELEMDELSENDFPHAIGWWNWFNSIFEAKIGKQVLLYASIYNVEEFHNGIIWQLTNDFTEKPKPELIKSLKALLPKDHKLRIVIGMD